MLFPAFVTLSCLSFLAQAMPLNAPLLDSYDYIVVGGGASGLTVANRLSEDPSVTVLVLEAGQADNYEENILVPIFVGSSLVSQYDWGFNTVDQTFLDGKSRWLPQGKALGGGTILNAFLWNRGNAGDYDAWVTLGNPGWGWSDLLPYFMKSETYTPVDSPEIAQAYGITNTPDIHGTSGPVSVTYQKYFYNVSLQWYEALASLGMPAVEPNDGTHAGAMFLPMDLNATNMTRADARRSYYEPFKLRNNFYVSTGQHVTELIFSNSTCNTTDSTLRIAGVRFATDSGSTVNSVYAKREVILAAGSTHTPQILELSGIGMKSVLSQFNIDQKIDLPGVGNNLQDHFQAGLWAYLYNTSYVYPTDFNNNATLMDQAKFEYYLDRTGPWTAGPPNGVAFPSLSQISSNTDSIADSAGAQSEGQYLEQGLDATVVAGYEAMKPLLESALRDESRSVIEILNNNAGGMSMSNMRPFCRGHSHIGSTDPFGTPLVDPRWGSNPIDIEVLVESVYFNRKVFQTPAMEIFGAWQAAPTVEANRTAVRSYIVGNGGTEYHPSGTCAMLPKSKGGVVSPELLVYGTSNLRIVDASIYPILPAAHLQAVVYGVAEKAADIIKNANTPATDPTQSPVCSAPTTSVASPAASSAQTAYPKVPSSASNAASSATNIPIGYPAPGFSNATFKAPSYPTRSTLGAISPVQSSASGSAGSQSMAINNAVVNKPLPAMQTRPILFPGSYPDTHPFDHPWDPEPAWNPQAVEHSINTAAYGPAPAPGSGDSAVQPVYGQALSEAPPAYAATSSPPS